jgi:adhesin transport system outer membrane protein
MSKSLKSNSFRVAALGLSFACTAFAQPAAAQVADTPRTFTLRQAVAEALLRNPARVRASHDVTTANFDKDAADWGRFPKITVDAGTGDSGRGTSPATTVRLEQPLWAGGRIEGQIDAARSQVTAAGLAEGEARRRIAEETAAAYAIWMHSVERVEIASTGAQSLEELLRYVRRRESEGLASLADVSIASARHGSALGLREELRGALEQARATLESLTITRVGGVVPVAVPEYESYSAADTEAAYVANSQLVAQRRAEVETARAQATVRMAQMYPTLALRLEHLRYRDQSPLLPREDSRALLVLQFSPDAGLSSYSGYQAAQSRVDSVLAQAAADENEARLRARANWAEHQSSRRQVAELEPQVAALDSTTSSFMRQFEAGRKSWLEVLNTQREVLDAKLLLARARAARDQSALRLMVNTGTFWTWLERLPQ